MIWFILSAKISIDNTFAYFRILKLAWYLLKVTIAILKEAYSGTTYFEPKRILILDRDNNGHDAMFI